MHIDEVINTYKKTVLGIALSHTGSKFDADDVFQEVFLIYYKKNLTFQDEEHRKAWLIRTTLNYCKKARGSSWRKKTVSFNVGDDALGVPQTAHFTFALEEQNLVHNALLTLPEKYRTVLYLFYFVDLSTEETANILGATPGNIRVRLKRGRDLMREKLKGDYFYE